MIWLHSVARNKIPLADQATSGNLRPQLKAVHGTKLSRHAVPEIGMPDIKIVTEVAGRVCALPVDAGSNVGDGDEIAFVEAMKMEIPVTTTAAGKIKAILVRIDEMIAEGQAVAIVET
ncbi:biotin carboxyl carrier protein [Bradyrhizobium sp. AZCC 2289]|jgi:biotin carboxyl carrier protein